MNEREAWQYIGEAFEQYAETGEETMVQSGNMEWAQSLVSNGLCAARYRLHLASMIDVEVSNNMFYRIQDEVRQMLDVNSPPLYLSNTGREHAAVRAMLCYIYAADLEQETENAE